MFSRAGEEAVQLTQQLVDQVPMVRQWIDSCVEDTDSEQAANTGVREFSDIVRNLLTNESGGELSVSVTKCIMHDYVMSFMLSLCSLHM